MMNNQTSMQARAAIHKENIMPQSTTTPTVQARRHWLPRQLAKCAHTVLVLGLVVYLGCFTPKIPCLSVLAAFRTSSLPCRIMAQNSAAAAAADQAAAIRSSTSIHIPAAAESACSYTSRSWQQAMMQLHQTCVQEPLPGKLCHFSSQTAVPARLLMTFISTSLRSNSAPVCFISATSYLLLVPSPE